AVHDADVICTATTSTTPVYHGQDVKPGAHINGVGAYTPEMQENDEVLLQRASKIVVDSYSGALAEAGDLLIAIERGVIQEADIYGELGEITSGKKPGRERDEEITFFKSVGSAVQDASVAQAILRRAEERNLGTVVEL
ncbi:MAG: ornithine cyclodeaminase family protein, partial [Rudaea sp.]